jgi:hypothetical protein
MQGLSAETLEILEAQIPDNAPWAYVLNEMQFWDLLDSMHQIAQSRLPPPEQKPLSAALLEHYTFKLLHSGTVIKLRKKRLPLNLYALARSFYAPKDQSSRLKTATADLVRTFELLQHWIVESPNVLRAVEMLDVAPDNRADALQELDHLLKTWADKYHIDGGESLLVQLAAGSHNPIT